MNPREPHGNCHSEGGAGAHYAFDMDGPTKQLDKPFGNGQAQPRADILFVNRWIDLMELVEDIIQMAGGYADARISNDDFHPFAAVAPAIDLDRSLFRKFHRIGEQVEQNLAQLFLIDLEIRQAGVDPALD